MQCCKTVDNFLFLDLHQHKWNWDSTPFYGSIGMKARKKNVAIDLLQFNTLSTYLDKMSVPLSVLLTLSQVKRKTFPDIRKKAEHTLHTEVFQRYTGNQAKIFK